MDICLVDVVNISVLRCIKVQCCSGLAGKI